MYWFLLNLVTSDMITQGTKKLFLLDSYALIYRAYFAFIKNPRINSKGLDTSAIYGYLSCDVWWLQNRDSADSSLKRCRFESGTPGLDRQLIWLSAVWQNMVKCRCRAERLRMGLETYWAEAYEVCPWRTVCGDGSVPYHWIPDDKFSWPPHIFPRVGVRAFPGVKRFDIHYFGVVSYVPIAPIGLPHPSSTYRWFAETSIHRWPQASISSHFGLMLILVCLRMTDAQWAC